VVDHESGIASRIDRSTVAVTSRTKIGRHPISMIATGDVVLVGVQQRSFFGLS
jgi:hypothetical protein